MINMAIGLFSCLLSPIRPPGQTELHYIYESRHSVGHGAHGDNKTYWNNREICVLIQIIECILFPQDLLGPH